MNEIFKDIYLGEEIPYLRPYICNGNPYNAKICLVGINPATAIYPSQINKEDYLNMIYCYDKFLNFYKKNRISHGKTEISRTRMGISAFSNWVKKEFKSDVIETDIFTYPTSKIKQLKNVNKDILRKSTDMFWNVIQEFKPVILILYGASTVKRFYEKMEEENMEVKYFGTKNEKIEKLEMLLPFATFKLNSNIVNVLATRHFMYYGKEGKSFEYFKNNLRKILEEN